MSNINLSLLPSCQIPDGFIVQVTGLNGRKIEDEIVLRGANLYLLPGDSDKFIVIPIFPPIFQEGSLSCRSTNSELSWFIDLDRNIYLIDFHGKGLLLKDGHWVESKYPLFVPSVSACISFLEWLESEHKRIEKEDALIQTLIFINDEDTRHLPQWLIETPNFLEKWLDYKAYYKNLSEIYYDS